jgi:hypothetical protein
MTVLLSAPNPERLTRFLPETRDENNPWNVNPGVFPCVKDIMAGREKELCGVLVNTG